METIDKLKNERAKVAHLLEEKTTMRDELNRAVFSLSRAVSNIDAQIEREQNKKQIDTAAADAFMNIFNMKRVDKYFEEYENEY